MHVILRFELEQDLLEGHGRRCVTCRRSGTGAWTTTSASTCRTTRAGVLQDMHWGTGPIGYFPTYSLGNVMSVQIWERIKDDLPDLDDRFERGEFGPLREWLGEHIHRHGRKFLPQETLERAVGARDRPRAVPALPAREARRRSARVAQRERARSRAPGYIAEGGRQGRREDLELVDHVHARARDRRREVHGDRCLKRGEARLEVRVWPTLEVTLEESQAHLRKRSDAETGWP